MGVINKDGALYFATGIDNSGLKKDSEEAKRYINDISDFAKKAGIALGAAFSVGALKQFASEVINVRGEIQQLGIAFETMLGSKERADRMMSDIVDMAKRTPFTLTDVATNAKQLMAMGIAADEVIGTLKSLGDVAAGVSVPISRIAINYGQVRALGRLQSREIRDFAMAGIPIVEQLANMLGKTASEIYEMVDAGSVGFPLVEQAFKNMSGEGGKFYNLMEKQNSSLTGQIEKLKDEIQLMFNEIGESQEGVIYGSIGVASSLVENYERVGKTLMEVVVAYGAYKAALLSVDSYNKFTASIKYAEEAKSLEALLTVEEKKRISALNLKSGTEAHVKAIQGEIEARTESLKAQIAESAAESNSLAQKRIAAKEAKVAASENVAAKQAELAAIIGTAEAEKTASLQKNMMLASEKQSRAALLVNKLEERKADAISQAQNLKEIGATEEKIAAKNREIASIQRKIVAAREEEIQQSRNVTALRSEAAAVSGRVSSKEIEAAQNRLNTAVLQENTAAQNYNTTVKGLAASKAKAMAAAQQLETLSTNVDTASKKSNITFTTLLSAAKTRLTAVAARLNAVLAANAFSIAIAGAAALTYGLYKLITYQTTAEKQQKKLNESLETEKLRLDALIESFKRAEPGTERYKQIKEDINNSYGAYLSSLNLEIDALRTSKDAYKLLSDEIEKNTRAKLRNQFIDENNQKLGKNIGGSYSSLRKRLTGDLGTERGRQAFADIKARIEDATIQDAGEINQYIRKIFEESGKSTNFAISKYYKDVNSILSSKYQLKEVLAEADDIFGDTGKETERAAQDINKQIEETKTKISTLKKDLADLRSGKTASTDYKSDIETKEKELKAAKEALELLTGISEKEGVKNTSTINQVRDDNQKLLELRKQNKKEEDRLVEDLANKSEQAEIDAMQDGFNKTMRQRELNHQIEIQNLKRQKDDYIERIIQARKEEFDAEEDIKSKKDKNYVKKSFDGATISVDASDYDKIIAEKEKQYPIDTKKSWNDLALEFGDYYQKRLAIAEKWEKEIAELPAQFQSGARIKMNAELAGLDDEYKKTTNAITELFKDTSEKTSNELRKITDEAERMKDFVIGGQWNASEGADFGITEAQFKALNEEWGKSPEKLEAIIKAIRELKREANLKENTFKSISNSIEAIFNPDTSEKGRKKAWSDLATGIGEVNGMLTSVGDNISSVFSALGNENAAELAGNITNLIGGVGELGAGIAQLGAGDIIGGIKSLSSGISNVVTSIFRMGDAAKEKKIRRLQDQIDSLKKSYDDLDDAIKKAYSRDAANLIEQNNVLLRQQQIAIQQQIKQEEKKKKTDKNKVKEWYNELAEIDKLIADNKVKAVDAIFGEDVQTAISNFAQAYVDMWAAGDDKAKSRKDFVKNMIKSMIMEAMKSDISKPMEAIRKQMDAFWSDGRITDAEANIIDSMVEDLQNQLDRKYSWADKYIQDKTSSGVTGELKAQMTEQTGSQLVGLWNMTAMDIRAIREHYEKNPTQDIAKELNSLLNELQAIRANTGRTADNTDNLDDGIKALKDLLEEIKKNTKPNNSRL